MSKGRVTIPSEENFFKETMEVANLWKADAIRNSDGTHLDADTKNCGLKVYNAYFPMRGHNEFIQEHMDECPQVFLMSKRTLAKGDKLVIAVMEEYFKEQLTPNYLHNPKALWEVINRSTGEVVSPEKWSVNQETHEVTIYETVPWEEYTVSFLAFIIWDPVEMYNHLTNDWGDKEHEIPFDVLQPNCRKFIFDTMKSWLEANPEVSVVRFTTFFYQFALIFNQFGKEKFVDWFGYGASVSKTMLDNFEAEYGYALRAEDFVDEGYYNSSFRIPTRRYLDYMAFLHRFVVKMVGDLSDLVHGAGKESMMFLGDQWLGAEPYGKYAKEMKLDAVVGSVGDGTTLRMISDIPHVKYTEGRFLPYFFPDTFFEGNDAAIIEEARTNWVQARRAILRSPIQRMGYGGYLSLATKFPKFIETVTEITEEFRTIHANMEGAKPKSELVVAILNHWGSLRTWQAFTVAHALYSKEAYSYYGVLEALSGMSVDVKFISFDEILENGIDPSIDVIINAGKAYTAFSGGEVWENPHLVTLLTDWVARGGGFIGIGEPSALMREGKYFQLAHLLGVDKEIGFSLSTDKYFKEITPKHFITEEIDTIDFGESQQSVYSVQKDTAILEYSQEEIHLAANVFEKGRTAYIAGLPFNFTNARLLMRTLYHVAGKEEAMFNGYSSNIYCEVNLFENGKHCVINNQDSVQKTTVYLDKDTHYELTLQPYEIIWK